MKKIEIGEEIHYTYDDRKYSFICIGHQKGQMLFICNKSMGRCEFGKDNKWRTSTIRSYIYSEFYSDLSLVLGNEWLTASPGDGGNDEIFLLTIEDYEKYKENIRKYTKLKSADWWLLSPYKTTKDSSHVQTNGMVYQDSSELVGDVVFAFWVKTDT